MPLRLVLLAALSTGFGVAGLGWSTEAAAQVQGAAAPQVILGEQIELSRLVDIAAQRLKVNIEYDAAQLKGTVTLRLGAGISDQDLWELTNRLLAARGFVTVKPPGRDGVLSVVKIEAAAGLTQIQGLSPAGAAAGPEAGFGAMVYRLKHRAAKDLMETVKGTNTETGEDTRPYRFGEFDILAVSMQPVTCDWSSFRFVPQRWLIPRADNPNYLQVLQPVPIDINADWSDDLSICIERFDSGVVRRVNER